MGWIVVLILGVIIGLLGKFVAPGDRDNIPLWLTVVCGVAGVLIGYAIFDGNSGLNVLGTIAAIVLAAIFVMIASAVTGRNTKSRV